MDLDLAAMMVANLRSGNPNQILKIGGLAQLVERLLCKQEVSGSTPLSSTRPGCLMHGVMSGVSSKMPGLLFYHWFLDNRIGGFGVPRASVRVIKG